MLNTAFDKVIEHERALANLKLCDRREERKMGVKGKEHNYLIPAGAGKLSESMTPRQSYIISVLEKKIDDLTLELLSKNEKLDSALDESFKLNRENKSLKECNENLSGDLKNQRSVSLNSQRRINELMDKLRRYVG